MNSAERGEVQSVRHSYCFNRLVLEVITQELHMTGRSVNNLWRCLSFWKNYPPSVSHLLKRLRLAISTHNPYVHASFFSRRLASCMHLLELNFRGLFYVQEIRKNITRNISTTVVQRKTYIYILKWHWIFLKDFCHFIWLFECSASLIVKISKYSIIKRPVAEDGPL